MQIAKYIFIDFCWTTTKQQAKNWKIVVSAGNIELLLKLKSSIEIARIMAAGAERELQ